MVGRIIAAANKQILWGIKYVWGMYVLMGYVCAYGVCWYVLVKEYTVFNHPAPN